MENVKKLADKLGVVPRLKLGNKTDHGVVGNGPHRIKFLTDATFIKGKDFKGNEQEQMKFIVEENGMKYAWIVPIKGKNGQPSYLIPHIMDIEIGDERVLEMKKHGAQNHIEVRMTDEEVGDNDDDQAELDQIAEDIPLNEESAEDDQQ